MPDIADSTQRFVLLLLACVACGAAHAQDLDAALRHCTTIASAPDRLACFDALARDTLNAGAAFDTVVPTTPPSIATHTTAPTAPAPAVAPLNDFGLEHRATTHPSGETLSATLAAVHRGGYGELRVTLDNGQVWEQVGTDRYQLKVGEQILIERGRFNSFFLRKQSSDRKVRFIRLK